MSPADLRFPGCTLALVAGGRGRRLGGVVKAGLVLPDGRTVLRRTLDELAPRFDAVLVAADDPAPFPGLRVVPDAIPDRGAPGGVHAACAAAGTRWLLALGADMPFVDPAVLGYLWSRREGTDVVAAALHPRGPEALHAFYRTAPCAVAFGRALRSSAPGFRTLLAGVRTLLVPAAELRVIDPELRSFADLDTPADLAAAGVPPPGTGPTRPS